MKPTRLLLALLATAALSLALVPASASAAKSRIFDFGSAGTLGRQFSQARDIAVNETGNGGVAAGTIYVNEFGNSRVSSFDASGNFLRTWGWDVVQEGRAEDTANDRFEVCTIAADCKAGISGSGGGQFASIAGGLAVHQASGNVYVLDRGSQRVQVFDADGDFVRMWGKDVIATGRPGDLGTVAEICTVAADCKAGATGARAGEFGDFSAAIAGIGVDAAGNAYVTDTGNARVQKFDSSGNFIAMGGWDVTIDGSGSDPGSVTTYQVCSVPADCKAGVGGTGVGQFAATGLCCPNYLDVHSTGDVYVVGRGDGTIYHLSPGLAFDAGFAPAAVPGTGSTRNALAVNTADGHLFFAKFGDSNIYELDTATQLVVETHPADTADMVGLAVNSVSGRMYADFGTSATFVRVLDEAFPIPLTGAATDVTIATARLNGTINPNGVALDDCYFEYGRTTAYGTRVDCVPDEATIGSGTSPVAVSADIAGLQPNSTYHFRLAGENANGAANGADQSFSTPETVIAAAAAPIGGTKARLNGSVDPDGVAFTDCYFEYGSTTAYGTRADCVPDPATIGSGTDPVAVSADIAGLTPNGAAYNFRLVAEQGGDPIQSRNQPLTTATTVITESVSALAGTTATLNGLVDPDGVGLKDCSFEYGETTAYGTRVPCNESPGTIGAGAGNVSVSADISGLDIASTYHYRLTATYDHPADPFGAGEDRSLLTLGPTLKDSYAINASDTKATLGALINPGGEATTYRFEYGLTTAYGNQTAELGAGSDSADHTVTTLLEGLTPNTTYHFRAVATNPSGSASGPDLTVRTTTTAPAQNCPNEAIRAQQGTTHLPACLAYEMVTPPDKNQGSAPRGVIAGPSRDGNAAAFCTSALFGEPAAQMSGISCAPYLSRRTPSGWQTGFPFPQVCVNDRDGNNKTPLSFGGVMDVVLSANFERAAVERFESEACPLPPLDPAAALPGANFYRQDLSADPFEFDLLSPMAEGGDESSTYGDDDFSHIVYQSSANQTPEPDSPPPGAYPKIYEAVEEGSGGCLTPGGCVRLVSVRPDGAPFATESRVPARLQFGSWISTALGAVSADGSRIFFQNRTVGGSNDANPGSCSTPECELYLRENGLQAQSPLDVDGRCADDALACTYHVSRSECTVDCGVDSSPDRLLAANEAGDVAFFSSCTKLTDASSPTTNCNNNTQYNADSNAKIYRWDRFGTPTRQLVDISVDHEPADGVQGKAIDIAGGAVAADGDVAFFVAGGQIVAGEPLDSGIPGNFKLYRWRFNGGDPRVDYLGPYQPTGGFANTPSLTVSLAFLDFSGEDRNIARDTVNVTPDGRYLLLWTGFAYDPVADTDSGNDMDLYRWEEAEGWRCVSCQLPGVPSVGGGDANSKLGYLTASAANIRSEEPTHHAISDDGRRVFFSTSDALVPEDVNGETVCQVNAAAPGLAQRGYDTSCQDIYLWEDGRLSLITTGTGDEPFDLIGAGASGDRVFFQTRQRLVGWDQDLGTDIYTARVDGGFPEPPAQPPACEGDACRGAASSPANVPGAGSAAFSGPGNQGRGENTCNRFSKRARRKLAAARKAARQGQAKRARALRKQARNLNRRAKRCNRRAAS